METARQKAKRLTQKQFETKQKFIIDTAKWLLTINAVFIAWVATNSTSISSFTKTLVPGLIEITPAALTIIILSAIFAIFLQTMALAFASKGSFDNQSDLVLADFWLSISWVSPINYIISIFGSFGALSGLVILAGTMLVFLLHPKKQYFRNRPKQHIEPTEPVLSGATFKKKHWLAVVCTYIAIIAGVVANQAYAVYDKSYNTFRSHWTILIVVPAIASLFYIAIILPNIPRDKEVNDKFKQNEERFNEIEKRFERIEKRKLRKSTKNQR